MFAHINRELIPVHPMNVTFQILLGLRLSCGDSSASDSDIFLHPCQITSGWLSLEA